ncbi:MAG TPA: non-ribosomal peptide synthetase, partial [Thermoanaerobaculia bacterium]|nr:non-ribosomal peptide synthetase [Thermoanaerobaculia bacterium]
MSATAADPGSPLRGTEVVSGPAPSPFPALAAIELFEAQAGRHPGRTAVTGPDGASMTYAELDRTAEGFAAILEERGAGGAFVALCADPAPAAIAAILGIWKAGAVWVPLHPDQPPARLARQLAECGARWCFADGPASGTFSFGTAERLPLRAPRTRGRRKRTVPEPTSIAYGIFTSGSTGEPKLALLRHDSLVNYTMFVWQELLGGEEGLRFATPSSLAADLGHTCLFPALASGGTLEIPGRDVSRDATLFCGFLREREIDVLKIVPSHFAALSNAGADPAPRRLLVFGGEPLPPELARAAAARCPIVNHYGPTETTVGALFHRFVPSAVAVASVPIGRPIANVRAYVLDEHDRPAAPGSAGELWIGGVAVGEGYLGRPEESGRRFREDPFFPGGRVYRTGDRVRTLPDGSIDFLGRIDDQVKIRGHRVEPGEAAAILRRHPAVARAAVAVQRTSAEPRLVAAVVPRAGESVAADTLREFLAGELPEAWIPARIAVVDELPLAASGKVDLGRLAESAASTPGRPRNAVEEWIAGIWSEILGIPEPGVDDNFFALGGHSLAAMRIMARLRREIPAALPLPAIFRNPTVASLAA